MSGGPAAALHSPESGISLPVRQNLVSMPYWAVSIRSVRSYRYSSRAKAGTEIVRGPPYQQAKAICSSVEAPGPSASKQRMKPASAASSQAASSPAAQASLSVLISSKAPPFQSAMRASKRSPGTKAVSR
ncbi:MAG: hypothetical protein A2Y36_01905 [Treponema sp. GWA1_62_8]|nr:MAG: hypothetical protein A2Y36_01905 [Treponema sp. GWA1_62_8]